MTLCMLSKLEDTFREAPSEAYQGDPTEAVSSFHISLKFLMLQQL